MYKFELQFPNISNEVIPNQIFSFYLTVKGNVIFHIKCY